MATNRRETINNFLSQHRLAMVGVSREPTQFSHRLFVELAERGYDIVPVNPNAVEIAGRPCFGRVQEVTPAVDGVLVITSPRLTDQVIRDCAEAEVRRVWLHAGIGQGSATPSAIALCHEYGISVVAGECPYMFLPDTAFFHRIHGLVKKVAGSYPTHADSRSRL